MAEAMENQTQLTDLNTECYIEIFKHLNYIELYHLTKMNDKFYDAIEYIMANKDFTITFSNYENIQEKCEFVGDFLQLFGKTIKHLNFQLVGWFGKQMYWLLRMHLETLIKFHCMHGNVKHLSFNNFRLRPYFVEDNSAFFKSLTSIQMFSSISYHRSLNWFLQHALSVKTKKIVIDDRCFTFEQMDRVLLKMAKSKLRFCKITLDVCTGRSRCFECNDLTEIADKIVNMPVNRTLKYLNVEQCGPIPNILQYFPRITTANKFEAAWQNRYKEYMSSEPESFSDDSGDYRWYRDFNLF